MFFNTLLKEREVEPKVNKEVFLAPIFSAVRDFFHIFLQ